MWDRSDNQEVGLEAAILERVRNSSLVERAGADNVSGLKSVTEALERPGSGRGVGRGASPAAVKRHRKTAWSAGECECRHE